MKLRIAKTVYPATQLRLPAFPRLDLSRSALLESGFRSAKVNTLSESRGVAILHVQGLRFALLHKGADGSSSTEVRISLVSVSDKYISSQCDRQLPSHHSRRGFGVGSKLSLRDERLKGEKLGTGWAATALS